MINGRYYLIWLPAFIAGLGVSHISDYFNDVPQARIFTYADDHSTLNHGQQMIEVKAPAGMRFHSFGSCNPQWTVPSSGKKEDVYWSEINIQIEKYDQSIMGYKPSNPWKEK